MLSTPIPIKAPYQSRRTRASSIQIKAPIPSI